MKKSIPGVVCVFLLFAGCSGGDSGSGAERGGGSGSGGGSSFVGSVETENGVTVVEMAGNDRMKFNLTEFAVQSGATVRLTFENVGRMPKSSMGHNVVILEQEVDALGFVTDAAKAKENDFIPPDRTGDVLAHTKLLGPGESDTIEFTAPPPGEYEFVCSFPGHTQAGMRGVMTVEPDDGS